MFKFISTVAVGLAGVQGLHLGGQEDMAVSQGLAFHAQNQIQSPDKSSAVQLRVNINKTALNMLPIGIWLMACIMLWANASTLTLRAVQVAPTIFLPLVCGRRKMGTMTAKVIDWFTVVRVGIFYVMQVLYEKANHFDVGRVLDNFGGRGFDIKDGKRNTIMLLLKISGLMAVVGGAITLFGGLVINCIWSLFGFSTSGMTFMLLSLYIYFSTKPMEYLFLDIPGNTPE